MSRNLKTEVLVVGAGPTGMFTALLLAEAGVRVTLIDREDRPAAHSYACGLHPSSLKLLDEAGLLPAVQKGARKLERMAVYSDSGREVELSFAALPTNHPFVLVLPQNVLETLLVERITARGGQVLWRQRLSALQPRPDGVFAEVDQLVGTGTGSAVPRWEWVVGHTTEVVADYVVGADGHESLVRRLLGIECDYLATPELYVVYEFEPESPLPDELGVVVAEQRKSVLWPLPGGRCRWSFQMAGTDDTEFAEKDRNPGWAEPAALAQRTRERLEKRLQLRAPWFDPGIRAVDWAVDIQFQHRLARQYGRDRCWLVGDAAHQTAPAGIQSMNVGLREAKALAGILTRLLKGDGSADLLEDYERKFRSEWLTLLGAQGTLNAGPDAKPWVKTHAKHLLSSLPASGEDLSALLRQIGLTLA